MEGGSCHAETIFSLHSGPLKGYVYLRTADFIRELRQYDHHFTEQDANTGISRYQPEFVDKTPGFSENRFWMLRGMGGFANADT